MSTPVQAVVTLPPHADFLAEVAAHPLVRGLRLNTVMPLAEPMDAVLRRLSSLGPPLWVDLKGRQLRVVEAAVPPFTEVHVSHPIRVRTPCDVFFKDGREHARLLAVDGDRLILEAGPRRVIGPGESVNVVDASLEVTGTLTPTDLAYLESMKRVGLRKAMLSFVEQASDLAEVRERLPEAELACKIESRRGLAFACAEGSRQGRLIAARGDLYVEVREPHRISSATRTVLQADPEAWVASRIFPGLAYHPVPDCAEIGDVSFLLQLGYRTFLLGDDVCQQRDSVLAALNLLRELARELLGSEAAPRRPSSEA